MQLSNEQLDQVQTRILESGLKNYQLQIDLIDHIASSIEEQIEEGSSFENAIELAFKSFSSKQIRDIEYTTNILTTEIMQKRTKILGIVGLFIFSAGVALKMLHISGAYILMILGVAVLGIGFFGSNAIDTVKNIDTIKGKVIQILGAVGAFITITGGMLKLLHLPGALVLMLTGPALLLIYFSFSSFIRTRTVK